jgi:glycerol dehydrogenase-like iron-containing ADH family enzyme
VERRGRRPYLSRGDEKGRAEPWRDNCAVRAANWFSEEWLAHSPGEKVAFGVLCELMMENADDGTVDEVYRFCVDVVLPVTLAQLGSKT